MPAPYSILLSEAPCVIQPTNDRLKTLLMQAQGGNVSYRFGVGDAVDGFILRENHFVTVAPPLTVWASGLEARLVIQEMP